MDNNFNLEPTEKTCEYLNNLYESRRKAKADIKKQYEHSTAGKLLAETQMLRRELEKQNNQLEKQRADQAAQKAAAEHREKIAEIRGFLLGILGSVLAGLIIYYWPVIVSLFTH